MNAGFCIPKTGKKQTVGFHGKVSETAGKVVNKLMSFLEKRKGSIGSGSEGERTNP